MRMEKAWCVTAIAIFGAVACDQVEFPTPPTETFQAALSGDNLVPPVTTTATGLADFAVTLDTFLTFRVRVAAIDTPAVATLQAAAAGANGSAIVVLRSSAITAVGFTGAFGDAQRTPGQLTDIPASYGATPRARFDSLVALMRNGQVYVNIAMRRTPPPPATPVLIDRLRGQLTVTSTSLRED